MLSGRWTGPFTSRTSLAHCKGCDAVAVIDGSRSEELDIMGGAHQDVQAFSSQAVDAVKSSEQRLVGQVVQEKWGMRTKGEGLARVEGPRTRGPRRHHVSRQKWAFSRLLVLEGGR
jgi:hypothetical protein